MKKILLLGSGELGKEFVISAKRLGCYVVACDSYTLPLLNVGNYFTGPGGTGTPHFAGDPITTTQT